MIKTAIPCLIAFIFVYLFVLYLSKSNFVMGGALAGSRGQKGRKLDRSEFYQHENNQPKFNYNLGEIANKGSQRPATLNTVNPNWVRRRIQTTINSIIPSPDITTFPSTPSNSNVPKIGDTNWLSNPWVNN